MPMTVATLLKCYLKHTDYTLPELLYDRDSAGLNHRTIAMFISTREALCSHHVEVMYSTETAE